MNKSQTNWLLRILIVAWMAAAQLTGQEPDQTPLAGVLSKAAAYTGRVKQLALFFYCTETTIDTSFSYKYRLHSNYFGQGFPMVELKPKKSVSAVNHFDYQMVSNEKEMFEQRNPFSHAHTFHVPRSDSGIVLDLAPQAYNDLSTHTQDSLRLKYAVFGAVGFLSPYWQNQFTYKLLGSETINGRLTWIVDAKACTERKDNLQNGKIWIDDQDGSVHQIEMSPVNGAVYPEFLPRPTTFGRQLKCLIRFEIVCNRVRFPSSEEIRDIYISPLGTEFPAHSSYIRYHDYHFFVVGTEIDDNMN
jgi:hypothetical protein